MYKPGNIDELSNYIRDLGAAEKVFIRGGGTTFGELMPGDYSLIATTDLNEIVHYSSKELTLVVQAGTRLETVQQLLAKNNQRLAFEPPSLKHQEHQNSPLATIGGVVALNASGPRRILVGACRDHVLGVQLVTGNGDVIRSGGRVMKNVTGLDLCKAICGSQGTLGVITEVAFKVLPRPESEGIVLVRQSNPETALKIMQDALASPFEVSGACFLPQGVLGDCLGGNKGGCVVIRLEHQSEALTYRAERLRKQFHELGSVDFIEGEASETLWMNIRNCAPFEAPSRDWGTLLRVNLNVRGCVKLLEEMDKIAADYKYFLDWGGALLWLSLSKIEEKERQKVVKVLSSQSSRSTIIYDRYRQFLIEEINPDMPLPIRRINGGLKKVFDPDGKLPWLPFAKS